LQLRVLCHALEGFVVSLMEDALLTALHSRRTVLLPKDIQLARRVRGERR